MSSKLKLFDYLLMRGQRYQEMGRYHDAARMLDRLKTLPPASPAQAEQVQVQCGELCLKTGRFRRARRHLAAALANSPDNAAYHYLLARAFRAGVDVHLDRAFDHYKRSLSLDPTNASRRAEFGMLLVREGRTAEGLKQLRRAEKLSPSDPKVTARLIKCLRRAGQPVEAKEVARAALFRNPRSLAFLEMWRDCGFREMAHVQATGRRRKRSRHPVGPGPVLLPFIRPASIQAEMLPTLRLDGPATLAPPHLSKATRHKIQ